jgi:dTDP-4-amino-4,6-dideoxygalactose transaminase
MVCGIQDGYGCIKFYGEVEMTKPKQKSKISRDINKRILCLPIYAELEKEKQNLIIDTIKKNLGNK